MYHRLTGVVDDGARLALTLAFASILAGAGAPDGPVASLGAVDCDADDGGLKLPDGFCARVVAKDLGRARHIAVDEEGDLYVALRDMGDDEKFGVVALRDTTGDGVMDVRERFGGEGGTGIALRDEWLYFGGDSQIVRWPLDSGELAPAASPETVISDFPANNAHPTKPIVFDRRGNLFVSVGSPSNTCQEEDRSDRSPGLDPCPELERQAGIWRFDAAATDLTQSDGERFATGTRNTVALTVGPDGELYGAIAGRDMLAHNWRNIYSIEESAETPLEQFIRIREGDDYGWPYCFHDPQAKKKVLAPEYGGDGEKVGRCANIDDPLLTFPAHWTPVGLHFYTGEQFPESYSGGAFVAFHGSWNRSPLPQEGYKVVYVPFRDGEPTGEWEDFATGFREPDEGRDEADHRPVGLTEGPDGSLYVTDDKAGWVWRIMREAN